MMSATERNVRCAASGVAGMEGELWSSCDLRARGIDLCKLVHARCLRHDEHGIAVPTRLVVAEPERVCRGAQWFAVNEHGGRHRSYRGCPLLCVQEYESVDGLGEACDELMDAAADCARGLAKECRGLTHGLAVIVDGEDQGAVLRRKELGETDQKFGK